jgi:ferredoxin
MKAANIRALVAAFVLIGFVCVLVGGKSAADGQLAKLLLSTQFIPMLLKLMAGGGAVVLLLLLLVTFLFGRVYCSMVCPLGIFQDLIIFLSRRSHRICFRYRLPNQLLWYGLAVLTVVFFLFGAITLVTLLDPYSFFARIAVLLLKPPAIVIQNLCITFLETFDIYLFPPLKFTIIPSAVPIFCFVCLLILFGLAYFYGRWYCNSICPVGALLGLGAQFSIWNVAIDGDRCTTCGRCERRCRSNCIDAKSKRIDLGRCVACFDCLDLCPEKALQYRPMKRWYKWANPPQDAGKRRLLLTLFGIGCSAIALRSALAMPIETLPKLPATPPGSTGVTHFTGQCSACQLCVGVCPTKVLQPRFFGYGFSGMMQPVMDFDRGHCDYECNACTLICPTNAIFPVPLEQKKRIQIGEVNLFTDRCIVYVNKRDCGACAEVCPTHAVFTVVENRLHVPKIKAEVCTGCGACQHVCPTHPKSILIRPHRDHATAEPPFFQVQEVPRKTSQGGSDSDFPF